MPSEMVPAQQLSDAGEDLVRLAAAKDAEIAALTEQRDRAMKVARALYKWAPRPWITGANVTWPEWDAAYDEAEALFAALEAAAAAEKGT